ncbi:hypothetical protein Dform_01608 [Dehalogenimonas formicexedens]|uniref:DOMON domain-containing protein n=1 Tax=Dehalogenimonas formicexedens TaxID=1839801 RepID=A0A1P8F8Y4_9CHLR|nr:DOMON domain-containing protein [Dehalogenimonas formicexedens]APV44929.1 hypothetical protein Dform_01608 [Dehalogenimonas formicexedens]
MKLRNLKNSISLLAMIVPFIIALSAMTACGGGPTATTNPPTSQPPTTPAGTMDFPSGKYQSDTLYSDQFRLAYTVASDGIISIGIKARTTGWVAIAIGNPHGQSDVWIGYVSSGQVTLLDTYNASYSGSHPLDTGSSGGTNDLTNVTGSEANGITTIEFKRKLDTGDKNDLPLVAGSNIVMWAIGPADDMFQEHSVLGIATFEIQLNSGH